MANNIPYDFPTPTPKFFFRTKFLDPSKESYTNRRKFLDYISNNCYSVPCIKNGIQYEAYELSFSVERAAEEAGISVKAFELLLNLFLENEWMVKKPNQIKNRQNFYRFEAHKIAEKIVSLKEEALKHDLGDQGGTVLREKELKKGGTDLKKEEPKGEPREEPFYERKNLKKEEQKGEPREYFYRNDRIAIESSLSKSDNELDSRAREDLSLSCKGKITAFFSHRSYKLRNGQPLSQRMQNSLSKYSPSEQKRLLPNVQFYEEFADSGKPIQDHEKFLQKCISEDYAQKNENSFKNDLYARLKKEEYSMHEMEILKTVVKIRKSVNEHPETISKELPNKTFENILDNYINNYYSENLAHAH